VRCYRLVLVWLLAATPILTSAVAAPLPRAVLIINESDPSSGAPTTFSITLRETLADVTPHVAVYGETLDLSRFAGPKQEAILRTYLQEKYSDVRFGVIAAVGLSAFELVRRWRAELWPGVPVVFAAIDEMSAAKLKLDSDTTGLIMHRTIKSMMSAARLLVPDLKGVAVLGGSLERDAYRRQYPQELPALAAEIEVTNLTGLPLAEQARRAAALPDNTAILYTGLFIDNAGTLYSSADSLAAIAKVANRPIVIDVEVLVGLGATGGYALNNVSYGKEVAALVRRILDGAPVGALPVAVSEFTKPVFDWRQLQRWGIDESTLPEGSEIRFRPPTAWEQYRWQIMLIAAVLLVQTLLIAYVLMQNRRRRAAENSLAQSEERMAIVAASTNTGLWQLHTEDRPIWATKHCRSILRLAEDAPLSFEVFRDSIHPDDRRSFVKAIRSAVSAGRPIDGEFRLASPGDEIHWIAAKGHPRRGEDNRNYHINGVLSDVTAVKTAEGEAELQRREIARLMRQSVLGELSGAIAHELNQPLTAILSNAEAAHDLLGRKQIDLEKIREIVADIIEEDTRASDVMSRIRKLLRKGGSKSEILDLNQLVSSTVDLLHGELVRRKTNVEIALAEGLPTISGDPVQLQQVLLNAILNAMEAMGSNAPWQRVVKVMTRANGNQVQAVIVDSGHGISPEHRTRLFQPFFTTKEHGLGLGLSICSKIVKTHGGMLTIENNPGAGATVTITLPIQDNAMVPA
jgi:signal transduction histidine kinase